MKDKNERQYIGMLSTIPSCNPMSPESQDLMLKKIMVLKMNNIK